MTTIKYSDKKRKYEHVNICQQKNVDNKYEIFKNIQFTHNALPELNLTDILTNAVFLKNNFNLPLYISAITEGTLQSEKINNILFNVAKISNIPVSIGSQKILIKTNNLFSQINLRQQFKDIFLIGNIGANCFNYGIKAEQIINLIEKLELNAFTFHLNPLQECIQPEGETDFSNVLKNLEHFIKKSPIPIIIKEVGAGISENVFIKLANIGVNAVDIAGWGGTNWSLIESFRGNKCTKKLGNLFNTWGLTTDESLKQCLRAKNQYQYDVEIYTSGGIRTPLDIAKALALGTNFTGMAAPFLNKINLNKTEEFSINELIQEIQFITKALKIIMFCTSSLNILELKNKVMEVK